MVAVFVVLALGAAGSSDAPPVTVILEKTTLTAKDALVVVVENHLEESVFLPGCNHFLIEMKTGDSWKVTREKRCFWEGLSEEVAAGKSRRFEETIEGLAPGSYRVRVDYSKGCKPGVPLSEGNCGDKASTASTDFTVK